MAPGMALLFLMYTVSYGGRSILAERSQGTLPRLLVSPTSTAQVLGGKVLGIFFTGVAQVGILILASTVFFGVKWGDALGSDGLILATVFGATGWGMLITALARTPAQVGSVGSALMLIFGILGGSFINLEQMPACCADSQQDHPKRLGAGWIYHAGSWRNITQSDGTHHRTAHHGRGVVWHCSRAVQSEWDRAEVMP